MATGGRERRILRGLLYGLLLLCCYLLTFGRVFVSLRREGLESRIAGLRTLGNDVRDLAVELDELVQVDRTVTPTCILVLSISVSALAISAKTPSDSSV